MGSTSLMEAKMAMADIALAKEQLLKKAADQLVKNYMSKASKETNKDAVVKTLDQLLADFSDHDKYVIMAHVFAKIA